MNNLFNYFKRNSKSNSASSDKSSSKSSSQKKVNIRSSSSDKAKSLNRTIDDASVSLSDLNKEGDQLVFKDDDPSLNKYPTFANQMPFQPRIEFPRDNTKQRRKFSVDYYSKCNWIEYSVKTNLVFCFTCRYFNSVSKGNKNDAFIKGTCDWKNLSNNIKRHNNSQHHKTTYEHWINRISNNQNIASKLSSAHEKEVQLNRKNLATIISAIFFLAKQGLALRGHDEIDKSKNNGNFLELLNLLAQENLDLKKHIETSNYKYICHSSQDQIISLISQQIKRHIVDSIDCF
jgi:hypothetical protein